MHVGRASVREAEAEGSEESSQSVWATQQGPILDRDTEQAEQQTKHTSLADHLQYLFIYLFNSLI